MSRLGVALATGLLTVLTGSLPGTSPAAPAAMAAAASESVRGDWAVDSPERSPVAALRAGARVTAVRGIITSDAAGAAAARLWTLILDTGRGAVGTRTATQILRVPVTDSGTYRVRLNPSALTPELLYRGRQLNLLLLADLGGRLLPYATSVTLTQDPQRGGQPGRARFVPATWPATTQRDSAVSATGTTPATVDFSFGARADTVSPRGRLPAAATSYTARAADAAFELPDSMSWFDPAACSTTWGRWYYPHEKFMRVQNWRGAPATVTQGRSSTHTLGVGVAFSTPGAPTTWRAAGTLSVSRNIVESIPNIVQKWIWNKVNYRDEIMRCTDGRGHVATYTNRRPMGINTAFSRETALGPATTYTAHCIRRAAGYSMVKDTARNLSVTAGVDIGPLSVSAQSGWDNGTSYRVKATRRSWLCWNSAQGPDASHTVQFRWKRFQSEPCDRQAQQRTQRGLSRCRTRDRVH
jgi:hypothetical protein